MTHRLHYLILSLLLSITSLMLAPKVLAAVSDDKATGYLIRLNPTTKLSFSLQPHQKLSLKILNNSQPPRSFDINGNIQLRDTFVGVLSFDDQDCKGGHKVKFYFSDSPKTEKFVYFKNEFAWNEPILVQLITSKSSTELSIDINGEIVTVVPKNSSRFLFLEKRFWPIKIEIEGTKSFNTKDDL